MQFDTIIRGGTVVTAADTFRADIGISNGRISAMGDDLGTAAEIIDATGLLVMPGGIDSHVHLDQAGAPGIVMADGFESGTRSAAIRRQHHGAAVLPPAEGPVAARGARRLSGESRWQVLHRCRAST